MITAEQGYIQFLGTDFGFWLLGVWIMVLSIPLEILCAGCHAVEKMTRNMVHLSVTWPQVCSFLAYLQCNSHS